MLDKTGKVSELQVEAQKSVLEALKTITEQMLPKENAEAKLNHMAAKDLMPQVWASREDTQHALTDFNSGLTKNAVALLPSARTVLEEVAKLGLEEEVRSKMASDGATVELLNTALAPCGLQVRS